MNLLELPNTIADKSFLEYPEIKKINEEFNEIHHRIKSSGVKYLSHIQDKWTRRWEYCRAIYFARKMNNEKIFKNIRMIDIGGAGTIFPFHLLYHSYNCDVHVTDLQEERVNWVYELNTLFSKDVTGYVKPIHDDITSTKIPYGSYDIVFCISVLEHIPRQLKVEALKNLRNIVLNDGIIALTFDYGVTGADDPIRSKKQLYALLEEAGLKLVGGDFQDFGFRVNEKYIFASIFLQKA